MKKSIFFAALAAAAVAMPSCSNDEGVEVNQRDAIKFNVFAGKTSRAVAIENNTISQFHIWGVAANNTGDFFMNCDVKKEGDLWTYSPTKFWPQSNKVNFFGISAGRDGNYVDITDQVTPNYTGGVGGFALNNYTVVEGADLDVLYAAYFGAHKATGTVPMNFHHALTQLAFGAKCTNADLTIRIKSIRVQNIANQGTMAGPTSETKSWLSVDNGTDTEGEGWGVWSGQTGSATYTAPFFGNASAPLTEAVANYSIDTNGKNNCLMVLPQAVTAWDAVSHGANLVGSRFLISCQILSGEGTSKTQIWPASGDYAEVAIPVPAITWKQGKRYVYNFNFNKGAGYTPDPDPEDPNPDPKPQPVLKDVKIKVSVDEFQNGGTIGDFNLGDSSK